MLHSDPVSPAGISLINIKIYLAVSKVRSLGSLLQSPFDSTRVRGTNAARFWGFVPLIRHLHLGSKLSRYPMDLVVGGVHGPQEMSERFWHKDILKEQVFESIQGLDVVH